MPFQLIRRADTGPRDLSVLAVGLTAGAVRFQSKNGWNILDFGDVRFTVSGSSHNVVPDPSALAPFAPLVGGVSGKGFVTEVNTSRTYRVSVNYMGGITIYGVPTGAVLNGSVMWPMNRPMPPESAFPGVKI